MRGTRAYTHKRTQSSHQLTRTRLEKKNKQTAATTKAASAQFILADVSFNFIALI
jgi:hypothetical protein